MDKDSDIQNGNYLYIHILLEYSQDPDYQESQKNESGSKNLIKNPQQLITYNEEFEYKREKLVLHINLFVREYMK